MTHQKGFSPAAWIAAVSLTLLQATVFADSDLSELVFVGSGRSNICAFWLSTSSGALTPIGDVAQIAAPSFLALAPNQKQLYAVTEGTGPGNSFINAYSIDRLTGKLDFINRQPAGGSGPCFDWVDAKGRDVLVANYGSGGVSVFPLDRQGALGSMSAFVQDHGTGVNPGRQEGPHAHCVVTGPGDRFAFACDLGIDKIMVFKFNAAKGTLTANDPPSASLKPGSGPRHIAFHPNGRYAYVISELASTLTAFACDGRKGALSEIASYPLLPNDFKGQNWAAEVAVHPSGDFVFASDRGDDSISVFHCDPATGKLNLIERDPSLGKTPRHFEIDPTGKLLLVANQDSGTIHVFRIDQKTGHLSQIGNTATANLPMCVKCLKPRRTFSDE